MKINVRKLIVNSFVDLQRVLFPGVRLLKLGYGFHVLLLY